MRVFVTGAAGFIGSATVKDLIANGHTVLGLARNDKNAEKLKVLGAETLRGDLEDLDSLRKGAESTDGTIHLAMIHDFANFDRVCAINDAATQAMLESMKGTGKPFVLAAGTLGLQSDVLAIEDETPINMKGLFQQRHRVEDIIREYSKNGSVRATIARFSPTVHADGTGGLTRMVIDLVHQAGGPAIYPGDGAARWSACYRDDAAACVRLMLEKGRAGASYHVVDEEGIPAKEMMEMIGRKLNVPVKSGTPEEAAQVVQFFAQVMQIDNPVSNKKTREELGWNPTGPGLIKDLEATFPY